MVKVVGPALSLDAKKSLKGTIIFQGGRNRTILTKHHRPGTRAPFVLGYYPYLARVHTSEAVRHWHLLSEAEREEWKDYIS